MACAVIGARLASVRVRVRGAPHGVRWDEATCAVVVGGATLGPRMGQGRGVR